MPIPQAHNPIQPASNQILQVFVFDQNVGAEDRRADQEIYVLNLGKRVVRAYCTHESAVRFGIGSPATSATVNDVPLAPGENIFAVASNITHLTFYVSDPSGVVTVSEMA